MSEAKKTAMQWVGGLNRKKKKPEGLNRAMKHNSNWKKKEMARRGGPQSFRRFDSGNSRKNLSSGGGTKKGKASSEGNKRPG